MTAFRKFIQQFQPAPIPLYIAKVIGDSLNSPHNDPENLIVGAGSVKFDLNPDGSYRSSAKTLTVQDCNGYFYKITVQEISK